MNQGFKDKMKSLMTLNTPNTPHKGILRNKYTGKNFKISTEDMKE